MSNVNAFRVHEVHISWATERVIIEMITGGGYRDVSV
jgi:hypothetical protein